MLRRFMLAVGLCGLSALSAPAPAQDGAANAARARETVTAIERLIDGIQARRAAGPAEATAAVDPDGWMSLFDGRTLAGWKQTDFRGAGRVRIEPKFLGGPSAIVVE